MGAIIIGACAGIICYYACGIVKEKLGVDDSLGVAAVHGVGGILGTLLVSYLGVGTFGGLGINKETAARAIKRASSRMHCGDRLIRSSHFSNRKIRWRNHRRNPSFRR